MTPDRPRRAAAPTPVAGGDHHIRPEWVEAAADEIAGYPIGSGYNSLTVGPHEARDMAHDALAAVVPAIQAETLRDLARTLERECAAIGLTPETTAIQGPASNLVARFRERADLIERGELP